MDLVVLSEVRWGYFRTRKSFLLSRFRDDPWRPRPDGRVTYFSVPFLKPATTRAVYNRLVSVPSGRELVDVTAHLWLTSRLRALGVEDTPVVLASNIYCPRSLSRLPRKLLFWDFNDHPLQFAGVPGWAEGLWRNAIEHADAFFVVSEHYRRELAQQTEKPLVLLGNGVETAHFETAQPTPAELEALPRPRIGYIGLLSHFLDFEVLEALRQARRGGTLLLLGPGTPATADRLREFGARPGVAVLGPRPYAELPGWMQGLDVGVIPFQASHPYVRGINPNKIYQYLAAGLPVVSTPVLDLGAEPPHLQFATDPDGFRAAVERALDAPGDARARRAIARPHDWDVLAARMVAELESRVATAA